MTAAFPSHRHGGRSGRRRSTAWTSHKSRRDGLRKLEKGGTIDAAWMAEAILNAPTQLRAERLDQLAFGQRAFAGIPDRDLPDALIAVRAFPRYRMLVLTLERLGIKSTARVRRFRAPRRAARDADPTRALLPSVNTRAPWRCWLVWPVFIRLDVTQEEALVRSLSNVPLTGNGYAGGIARWLRSELMPLLAGGGADVDATILQSVAGRGTDRRRVPVLCPGKSATIVSI